MSPKHFSHDHPLILKEELDAQGDDEIVCYGCQNPIRRGSAAADVYTCSSDGCDNFYLHKTCAELPKEINHPMHKQHHVHEQHPLMLHARPPYKSINCSCDVCKRNWMWFTYICISCKFHFCVTCYLGEDRVFRHEGHKQHTLTLMQRKAMFKCDACDTEDRELSYACNSCQFWLHKSCASSPTTVEPNFHDHPLLLTYSLPDKYRRFPRYCGICNRRLRQNYWLYYCYKCTYFVHINCVASSSETLTSDETEDNIEVDETNLVKFPVRCKKSFMDLIIDQFAKGIINLEEGEAAAAPVPQTINHKSHRYHPLILLEEVQSSEDGDEMLLLCNGCVQPVSTAQPCYGCIGCNFFLHRFCAELPKQLPTGAHSCHPQHPLVMRMNENKFRPVRCYACGLLTNGIFFECEECNIRFDIGCCFLPNRIKHKSHKHPLVNCAPSMSKNYCMVQGHGHVVPRDHLHDVISAYIVKEPTTHAEVAACEWSEAPRSHAPGPPNNFSSMSACSACGLWIRNDLFKCEISCRSRFQIHKECALLPSIMRHRWDPHPISLIYPPLPYKGLIYCEICEEEVDPHYWFYHCGECKQSFHTNCLRPWHNVKLGDKLVVGIHHPHTLTFVRKRKRIYCRPFLCCICKTVYPGERLLIFECANCDILLCVECALASK